MGRRGMSAEQKRQTLIKIVTDANRPMTLKEIELKGSKAGVVSQAIKDVVKDLCDDNLIEFDKIGSTNLYWLFKSKAAAKRKSTIKRHKVEIEQLTGAVAEAEAAIVDLEKERQQTEERFEKLNVLATAKAQIVELEAKLALLRKNDPRQLKGLEDSIEKVKEGAIRWTDNVYALHDYLKKKFSMPSKEAAKNLRMTDDFDYPEYKPKAKKAKTG